MPDLRLTNIRALLLSRPYVFAALLSVVLLVANLIAQPDLGTPGNWPEVLAVLAPLALAAMASTPQILSGGGGLDVSVGPHIIFWNIMIVSVLLPNGIDSAFTALPLILIGGAAIGAVNG